MNRLAEKPIIALLGFALGVTATFVGGYFYRPVAPECVQQEKIAEPEVAPAKPAGVTSDVLRLASGFEDQLIRHVISKPAPVYPPEAKPAGISGDVSVNVIIDKTGKVAYAWLDSGDPALSSAALDAAYRLRARPTILSGKPVAVKSVVTYKFILP